MSSFGPYTLIRRLAVGGMAEIFLAKREGPGGFAKVVALKHILPHLAGARDFVEMFLDEARIAARLDHPNIVHIHDFGEHDGSYFLAMEYVPGDDLSTLLARAHTAKRQLPLRLVTMILAAACQALHHAHELIDEKGRPLGIVHRDVSPSNLLLSIDGVVKLTDFGVAKAERKISQTIAGTRKGKGAYMSPEQARGKPVDRRSDVFALGAIAWEMVTGTRLFQREGEVPTMHAVTEGPIRPPRELRADLPDDLEAVILRALDRNPSERWQTARAMQRALEEASRAYREIATAADLAAEVRLLLGPADVRQRERWAGGDVAEAVDQTGKLMTMRLLLEPPTGDDSISIHTSELEPMTTPPTLEVERRAALGMVVRDDEPTTQQRSPAALLGLALRAGGASGQAQALRPALSGGAPKPKTTTPTSVTVLEDVARVMSLTDAPPAPAQANRPRRRALALLLGLAVGTAGFLVVRPFKSSSSSGEPDAGTAVVDAIAKDPQIEVIATNQPPPVARPDAAPLAPPRPDAARPRPARPDAAPPPPPARPDAAPPRVARGGSHGSAGRGGEAPLLDAAAPTHVIDFGGERRAFLTVDVNDKLRVLLDDEDIGTAPITRRPIEPGRHTLTLVSREEGHRNQSSFTVGAGETFSERRALRQGKLACDATPWAEVWIAGRKVGITPLPPTELTQGTYELRLFNPKLKREKLVEAKIVPGKTTRLRITLD